MPNEYPAADAYVLPNMFAPLGDTLNNAIALKERKSERDAALAERESQRKETEMKQNRLYDLNKIDTETDTKQYQTGQQAFDTYSNNELQKIKNNALTNYVGLDPAEMEYRLNSDMKGFLDWHNSASNAIKNVQSGLADLNKTYPNVDATKAHDLAFNNLANDYIQNGQRVDPTFVKPRDYVGELQNNNTLGGLVNDVSPLADYVQSFKPQVSSDSTYKDNQGYSNKYKYSAAVTPFSEIVKDANGKPIGAQLKSESVTIGQDANGSPIQLKLLPQEQVNSMMAIPKVKAAALGAWAQVKPGIEDKFQQSTGKPINPATEDVLFRKFLYDYIDKNNLDQHYFKQEESEKTPRITNNIYGANGTSINDVYAEVANKINNSPNEHGALQFNKLSSEAQGVILDQVNKVAAKDEDANGTQRRFTLADVFLRKDKEGNINVYRADNGQLIIPLDQTNLNLSSNTSQKQKQVILHNQNNNSATDDFEQYKRKP